MRVKGSRFCISLLALWALLVCASPLWANPVEVPVNVEADELRFDEPSGRYLAHGNVVLTHEGMVLKGDNLWWHPETGHAQVTGNAHFTTGTEELRGESFWINLNDRTGFATNGDLWLEERNTYIRGSSLQRLGDGEYRILNGRFTTCDADRPSWEFGGEKVDVTVGGFARIRHASFYLKGVPILYSPYVSYPVKQERESGFLMPRFGHSSSKGAQLSVAWYQVIADNQDATFYFDGLSKLGLGAGAEYRYIFGDNHEGEAKLYGILGRGNVDDQLALTWEHEGPLGDHTRLIADLEWVSDDEYFSDFGEAAEEYNKSSTTSVISTSSHWERISFGTQLKYIDDLETGNDDTLQLLPEIRFSLLRSPVRDLPIYTEWDSRYTHFWRDDGIRGHRLILRPVVATAFQPLSWLELDSQVGWWQRFYWTEKGLDDEQSKGLPDAQVRLSTRLSRSYDWDGSRTDRLLHSIEPEVRWDYTPDTAQDNLPSFDFRDRIEARNRLTFGLINRAVARQPQQDKAPVYLDLLTLRLSQSLELDEEPSLDNPAGDTLLPFRSELSLKPSLQWALDLDHRLSWQDITTEQFGAEVAWKSHKERHKVAVGYRYREADYEYLYGSVGTAALDPFFVDYLMRYDLQESNTLEQKLKVEYRHQCWSVFVQLADRDDEQSFTIGLSLSGVGQVGQFGGSLGGDGDD